MIVTIIGLGLIGGSLGLSLKKRGWDGTIRGFDIDEETRSKALELGLVDEVFTTLEDSVEGADIAVVAVPVRKIPSIIVRIYQVSRNTIITDVGSVKGFIIRQVEKELGNRYVKYVPGHPIAGTEKSGPEAALEDLFEGKRVILCQRGFLPVEEMWKFVGAEIEYIDPETHDKIFVAVSHLPHLVAYALVDAIVQMEEEKDAFLNFVASGFKDFTRIASSDPVMWRDIFLTNKKAILQSLIFFRNAIDRLEALIITEDEERLEKNLADIKHARDRAISRLK